MIEMKERLLLAVTAMAISAAAWPQGFERTPFAAPDDWTVTTYRAADTKSFLRCSAERHYDDGPALTVARTADGKYVLGVTSALWQFEDRSTHEFEVTVDAGDANMVTGRVRLLPSGPMIFVDVDLGSSLIAEISAGNTLTVSSGEVSIDMNLKGSAAALSSLEACQVAGTR